MGFKILTDVPEVPADGVQETSTALQTFFTETLPQHLQTNWHWYVMGALAVVVVVLLATRKTKKRKARKYYK